MKIPFGVRSSGFGGKNIFRASLLKGSSRFVTLLGLIPLAVVMVWTSVGLAQEPEKQIQEGKNLFEGTCADCHRINGQGLPDKFPALDGNPFVVGEPTKVIDTVLNGRKGKLGQMPTWKGTFTDRQLAAIISYVRQAWSNKAAPITADMVKKRRK